eukprot:TRINITY_DN678_c0_g1_i1.p1 TRINITY_DN678_c0_g1~~TRINITY_DN678_c0_g1_i1.p1  ORF type:complete len:322 (-),score=78.33 TRINITY_DN678_c0_g1_i1:330-1295(-)
MARRRVCGASNMTVMLQNGGIGCSADALGSLLSSSSTPRYRGVRSMVNFEGVNGNTPDRSFYRAFDNEETGDEDLDECFHQPEKKRRLTAAQVKFLERNFEVENKLEPERKTQLARDLGLQPRQVAIWFQNRRARWKTKQLEKDFDTLEASYNNLKNDSEILLKEKEKLKEEVLLLTDKLIRRDKGQETSATSELNEPNLPLQKPVNDAAQVKEHDLPIIVPKQEDLSSANSAIFDSDSPHYTDGGHSSLLEPANSSNIFEPDHSDLSHADEDEEDHLSRSLLHPTYHFPKLEDDVYPDPPVNSCFYSFPVEDQVCCYWPY